MKMHSFFPHALFKDDLQRRSALLPLLWRRQHLRRSASSLIGLAPRTEGREQKRCLS
jgi:hypothetical protein